MNRSWSSRVVLATAVVAALGFTAGCGDDSGDGGTSAAASSDSSADGGTDGGADGKPGGKATAPLSKAGLAKAALAKGDVKEYEITAMTDKEAAEGGRPKASRSECQPLAALMGSRFTPEPTASVFRSYARGEAALGSTGDPAAGNAGMLRISSYAPDDAERTVKELRAAVSACAGGFEVTDAEGERQRLSRITSLPDPAFGDDAVAYRALAEADDEDGSLTFAAVRSGAHVTATFTFNVVDPSKSEVPEKVLRAQVEKLAKAAKAADGQG